MQLAPEHLGQSSGPGQAQSHLPAGRLGREKRVHRVLQCVPIHSHSVIRYRKRPSALQRVNVNAHFHRSARLGLQGIDQQLGQPGTELIRVRANGRQRIHVVQLNRGRLGLALLGQLDRLLDNVRYGHGGQLRRGRVREQSQRGDQVAELLRLLTDQLNVLPIARVGGQSHRQKLRTAADNGQRIVHLVCGPGGHLTDGGQRPVIQHRLLNQLQLTVGLGELLTHAVGRFLSLGRHDCRRPRTGQGLKLGFGGQVRTVVQQHHGHLVAARQPHQPHVRQVLIVQKTVRDPGQQSDRIRRYLLTIQHARQIGRMRRRLNQITVQQPTFAVALADQQRFVGRGLADRGIEARTHYRSSRLAHRFQHILQRTRRRGHVLVEAGNRLQGPLLCIQCPATSVELTVQPAEHHVRLHDRFEEQLATRRMPQPQRRGATVQFLVHFAGDLLDLLRQQAQFLGAFGQVMVQGVVAAVADVLAAHEQVGQSDQPDHATIVHGRHRLILRTVQPDTIANHRRQAPSLSQTLAGGLMIQTNHAPLHLGDVALRLFGQLHDTLIAAGQNVIQRQLAQIVQQAAHKRLSRIQVLLVAMSGGDQLTGDGHGQTVTPECGSVELYARGRRILVGRRPRLVILSEDREDLNGQYCVANRVKTQQHDRPIQRHHIPPQTTARVVAQGQHLAHQGLIATHELGHLTCIAAVRTRYLQQAHGHGWQRRKRLKLLKNQLQASRSRCICNGHGDASQPAGAGSLTAGPRMARLALPRPAPHVISSSSVIRPTSFSMLNGFFMNSSAPSRNRSSTSS